MPWTDRPARDRVIETLAAAAVSAYFHYVPLHSAPAGRRFGRVHGSLAVTDAAAEQLVRLRRSDERQRYAASQRRGRIDPNPHQIDAVIFALRRISDGGCILADEVGLGRAHLALPTLIAAAYACFFIGQALQRRAALAVAE